MTSSGQDARGGRPMERVVQALCRVGGLRPDALSRVSHAAGLPATLGVLLIVTALVAFVNASYAIYRVFLGEAWAPVVGLMGGASWAVIVFCIDRLMVMSIDKSAPPPRLALQVLPRIALAAVIAAV